MIWTIGHSTRPLPDFLQLLAVHDIELLADVRRYPGSRRVPQFSGESLAGALANRDIDYRWLPSLGGRRSPRPDSRNSGWRSASFRGYADHMETEEFAQGLQELLSLASAARTAIMCAEAVWWRCHRSLIADLLRWLGWEVRHIVSQSAATPHPYTSPARLVRGTLSYAGPSSTDGGNRG